MQCANCTEVLNKCIYDGIHRGKCFECPNCKEKIRIAPVYNLNAVIFLFVALPFILLGSFSSTMPLWIKVSVVFFAGAAGLLSQIIFPSSEICKNVKN